LRENAGMKSFASLGSLVYSTDAGRMCPNCRQPQAACVCKQMAASQVLGDGQVRVQRETKGRGGKAVTLVRGLPLDAEALTALGKQLKAACGSGGTVKDGVIEVQGDHVPRVMTYLQDMGYKPKKVGG
jgi:translation initiation factor 1